MSKATILIVDDSKENITILLSLLDQYDVLVALSGEKALKMVEKHRVDMILLDIVMPKMNGYEVCEILKSKEESKEIPILFITAHSDDESIEKAFEVGGNDYVSKPFKAVELLARVKMHLKLRETLESLAYMATRDFMTGIYNRRKFFELTEKMFDENDNLYAIMIDIDNFKKINDTYGHPFGDSVIQKVVNALKEHILDDMVFGRIGGEEFAILSIVDSLEILNVLAEDMRKTVELLEFKYHETSVKVTISIGISHKISNDTLDMLLFRADEALYEAKGIGRNRVCFRE